MKFRSQLVIHLDHLKYNFEQIKKIAPQNKVLFMVKADGYGHGMLAITRYAVTELGITEFGCATLFEAITLREELKDLEFDIFVFSDTHITDLEAVQVYLEKRIIPVIADLNSLEFFTKHSDFKNIPLVLKINTGLNRLGFSMDEVDKIIPILKKHGQNEIHHLISHYANASFCMNTDERNLFQKENFNKVKKILLENGIKILHSSEANSGSIEQKNGLDNNTHIRPGIMMYGPSSLNSDVKNIGGFSGKTVSTLETHILKVFEVKKGIPVGYNSTLAPDDGIVAILAIGYGDGFFNRYSGAHLMHNGHVGKIIGRVSMDMTHVFFSSSAKNDIKSLDKFVIWGQENGDLVRFKNEVNIIPYELFCALLPRIPRVYKLN